MSSWPASDRGFIADGLIDRNVVSFGPGRAVGLAHRCHRGGVAPVVDTKRVHRCAESFRRLHFLGRRKRGRGGFSPTANGGSTEPTLTARSGSLPVASSHRPIQPVETGSDGEAVCQMSIDRKCLWSGRGWLDPADDGQLPVVPYLREALEGRIEAKLIVKM